MSEKQFKKKGWGTELWIHNDEDYCGKILTMKSDSIMSYHYHLLKKETFYCKSGSGWIILGGEGVMKLKHANSSPERWIRTEPGTVVEVPRGTPHMVISGELGMTLLEVSTQHFEEDSYRIMRGM